jgi:Xaa-Pro aminopeptidase
MAMPAFAPLINRVVAQRVLNERGIAAMVLADPTNIYQATGFWPQMVAMGQSGVAFAVVPACLNEPVILVTSQFMHYLHDVGPAAGGDVLDIFLYTAPDGLDGDAAEPIFLDPPPGGQPDPMDRFSKSATLGVLSQRRAYADARKALDAAIAPYGRRLAADTPVAAGMLGGDGAFPSAEVLLRRIRMVKSPREIDLMRVAARNNAQAARAAIGAIAAGSTYEDLRRAFFMETGRRGGIPLFISTDSMAMRQRDGVIREGRSFQIDAVSHYAGYHGDYGRTVFVGDPDPVVLRMVDAAHCANDAIAEVLAPGLRFSDVRRIGQEAVRKAGYDMAVSCTAHSVGLFHTDEAFEGDALSFAKADHLICKDMVLSIDCPVLHLDAGGNVHLEDLWLITENGCEPLNDRDAPYLRA